MSAIAATNSEGLPAVEDSTQLNILSKLKSIDQINKQRRIFLDGTITEEGTMGNVTKDEEELENNLKELEKKSEVVQKPIQEPLESPGRVLLEDKGEEKSATNPEIGQPNEVMLQTASTKSLNVKYATLPSPNTVTLRSPVLPPPKPPMLSRTRSIGSADGKSPVSPTNSLFRQSFPAGTATSPSQNSPAATSGETPLAISGDETPPATVSARHYEGLIEELRCPGCAGAMKAPILLCKGGHSICEQCTRILLMCPLCKESFTNSRSLTVEALCAKAHFRCGHAAGGCQVRMPVVLLPWHEQQCMYKPMKCFMGRVWGACRWQGREVQWKEHLEQEHADRLFQSSSANLEWNLATRRKPLTGYYVFQAHDEMFNFYEIHDHQRILFTMTCTSNRRDSKYNYAYEVTVIQPENEALSMTQKFPVHSEYDKDILMEGTCVSIPLFELNRFLDQEKQVLHYRVSVLAVKSPHRAKPPRQSQPSQPVDLEAAPSGGINGKSVPANMIITRTYKEAIGEVVASQTPTVVASPHAEDDAVSGDNGVPDIERKWGTPQLHFNRKYLRNTLNDTTPLEDELRPLAGDLRNGHGDDKLSLCSNNTSYTKKVSDSLRRSFRALKTDIVQMRPFSKKVVKASVQSNDNQ